MLLCRRVVRVSFFVWFPVCEDLSCVTSVQLLVCVFRAFRSNRRKAEGRSEGSVIFAAVCVRMCDLVSVRLRFARV